MGTMISEYRGLPPKGKSRESWSSSTMISACAGADRGKRIGGNRGSAGLRVVHRKVCGVWRVCPGDRLTEARNRQARRIRVYARPTWATLE